MDYIRCVFNLDFCTPRYIRRRELGIEKLKIRWGIRARRFEMIKRMEDTRWAKECWKEKRENGWKERYGKKGMEEKEKDITIIMVGA